MELCMCHQCTGESAESSWEFVAYSGVCKECGEKILSGEEYVDLEGASYHLECLDWAGVSFVLGLLEIPVLCS